MATQTVLGPYRPRWIPQGPASRCTLQGRQLGWLNCTCAACAMGLDQDTLGAKQVSACAMRDRIDPPDVIGGTNLGQLDTVIALYGQPAFVPRVGGNTAKPSEVATRLHEGKPVNVQGDAGALVGTPWRSTGGEVNHDVHAAEGKKWAKNASGVWVPRQVLVYDSAADHRKASWGTADQGPSWWDWATLLKFAAWLRPSGPGTPRIGYGRIYAGFWPFPGVRAAHGGVVIPMDRMHPRPPAGERIIVRSGPGRKYPRVAALARGDLFVAYQRAQGERLAGTATWYGGQIGTLWVHASGLRS